jgi:Predicted polymerase, most proteins contain PALM domain, HD hydrolase domain and Zn-ribbon domain
VPDISVTYTPDGMKAFLYVSDTVNGEYPSINDLQSALADRGITTGIDQESLIAMINHVTCKTYVEAAHGIAPVAGVPGSIEVLIDVSQKGKPRVLPGGKVDHRDISYVVNVRKGTSLVRHIPPVPGKDGCNIFGKPIAVPVAKDQRLSFGRGTAVLPADPDVLVADINGAVVVYPNGKVEVVDDKVISGNIDYSTGNVRFSGNLKVNGTVRAGFEIDAEGDCFIGGNVEDAKITSLGDIEVLGGAVGQTKGMLKCAGSLKIRHIANFSVLAGGDIFILEDALHSTISSEGNIKARSFVGGTVAAWKAIEAEAIGTEAEAKTIVDLGGKYVLMQHKYALLKELADLTGDIGTVKEGMFKLVRDEMDPAGNLSDGALQRLAALKKKHRGDIKRCSSVQNEMEMLDKKLKNSPVPFIKATKVFPNTLIKFGENEKLIKEKLVHAMITVDGDKIVVGKS